MSKKAFDKIATGLNEALDMAKAEAELARIEAEQRAMLVHRPWWWKLIGRTHLARPR